MEKLLIVPDSQDSGKIGVGDEETPFDDTVVLCDPTLQLEGNAGTVKLEQSVDDSETQELDDDATPSKEEEVSSKEIDSLIKYNSPASVRVSSMRNYAARSRMDQTGTEADERQVEVDVHRGDLNLTGTTSKQGDSCNGDVEDERHATKETIALSRCTEVCAAANEDPVADSGMGLNTQMAAETMQFISRGEPLGFEVQAHPSVKATRATGKRTSTTSKDVQTADANDTKRRRVTVKHLVLFSHGLSDLVVKKQTKFLQKLGGEVANTVSDCTHFVSSASFTRSVNMLEAVAAGKPVVTTSWLESSNVAGCFLNESKYILQDSKKERELGFSLSSTLSAAQKRPLLQDYRVHVTPNTRPPNKDVISIVKAAGGKVSGSRAKDLAFVISSEEDSKLCSSFLSRGIKVYSTELLLYGVVAYKLDFSKFQLFKR